MNEIYRTLGLGVPPLGERLARDRVLSADLRSAADRLERDVQKMRREADEIDRLAELAAIWQS